MAKTPALATGAAFCPHLQDDSNQGGDEATQTRAHKEKREEREQTDNRARAIAGYQARHIWAIPTEKELSVARWQRLQQTEQQTPDS